MSCYHVRLFHMKYTSSSWEYFHYLLWQNKWPFPFTNVKKPELLFTICLFKTHFVESIRNFNVEFFNRKIYVVTTLLPSSKIMTMANLQINVHVAQLKLICGRGSVSTNFSRCETVCNYSMQMSPSCLSRWSMSHVSSPALWRPE